jgi:hypothetical protein
LPKRFQLLRAVHSVCVSRLRVVLPLALALGAAVGEPPHARADREACIAAHEEAQLMRLRGRYTAARESLLRCAQTRCPALISNDCITWLAEVDASLPSVVFAVSDGAGRDLVDVRVYANGQLLAEHLDGRAQPLDPGVYTMRFEAPDQAPTEQVVTILEAQKQRLIRVQLAPSASSETAAAPPASSGAAPAPEQRRVMIPLSTYLLGGGALATLGTGIGLGVAGKQEYDRCEKSKDCTESEKDHGKWLYRGADIAFGLSVGLAATATWMYFRARKSRREQRASLDNLTATVNRAGASLGWHTAF